jgi:hypothetical protein
VLRAVDLHEFAQAIAPPARLVRDGKTMPKVLPQPIGDYPTSQGLARDRATVMLGQLLSRQGSRCGLPERRRSKPRCMQARQRYSRRSAPCTARYPSLLTARHLSGPHTRAKSRLLAEGGQNRARRGLSAGARGIRTTGPA